MKIFLIVGDLALPAQSLLVSLVVSCANGLFLPIGEAQRFVYTSLL